MQWPATRPSHVRIRPRAVAVSLLLTQFFGMRSTQTSMSYYSTQPEQHINYQIIYHNA